MKEDCLEMENCSGFTLLEVMAALTLTGIVIMAVLSLYSNSYSVYQHSMQRGEREKITQIIYERVADLTGAAYRYPYYDQRISSLQGDSSGLKLVTDRGEGLVLEELVLVDQSLIFRSESFRSPGEKREETLFTGISGEIRYMDDSTETWVEDWEKKEYPALIRLDLKLHLQTGEDDAYSGNSPRTGQALPPLVFPLMVEGEYGKP